MPNPCPPVAVQFGTMSTSMVGLGTKEDDAEPLVTLLNIEETMLTEPVRRLVNKRSRSINLPIAATNFATMQFYFARLGLYLEEGNPLAFTTMTTDAMTIQKWLPHEQPSPEIVAQVASLLNFVV